MSLRNPSIYELLKENRSLRHQVDRERQRATLAEQRAQIAEHCARQAWRLGGWQAPERPGPRDHGQP